MTKTALTLLALIALALPAFAGVVETVDGDTTRLVFEEGELRLELIFEHGRLVSERLGYQGTAPLVRGLADAHAELAWSGWHAPDRTQNAEGPALVRVSEARLVRHSFNEAERALVIDFAHEGAALALRLRYTATGSWLRRRLELRDPKESGHLLRAFVPREGELEGIDALIKPGGFGQPAALRFAVGAGAFFGVEDPTATTTLAKRGPVSARLATRVEFGAELGNAWSASPDSVIGLVRDGARVRHAFRDYVDAIRVAPLRPYVLYNTWYDVRAPEYTKRPEDVMTEGSLLRIIGEFAEVTKRHPSFHLDAFVLDDGWDVYKSDWKLREKEFPQGLAPIADALRAQGTDLGIWFGPTGGYSHRDWRVDWMREHGYETVSDQLCVAGDKYRALLERRVLDFCANADVGYYKWDGIRFGCNEPDHGHPTDLYARRAVMDAVAGLAAKTRAAREGIFLNITSGTWLSPWWLKHADTIWMQGFDYGYAGVPSISRRDRAMTYRDSVLFEDYGKYDHWFPLANLMTHGIIKGHLQKLGGEVEPLDKFTDNAVLYVARGVSMIELYVSPNLLSDGEWNAIVGSIDWAKDRFEVLRHTTMIGGDPAEGAAYGFVHFSGERGILALRNPGIEPQTLKVLLDSNDGLAEGATELVLERVYPSRLIDPALHAAGETLELTLDGYETAIYELAPRRTLPGPRVAGAVFEAPSKGATQLLLAAEGELTLLAPNEVSSAARKAFDTARKKLVARKPAPIGGALGEAEATGARWSFEVSNQAKDTWVAVQARPASEAKATPELLTLTLDGKPLVAIRVAEDGVWAWYRAPIAAGRHTLEASSPEGAGALELAAWLIGNRAPKPVRVKLPGRVAEARPQLPLPRPAGELREQVELGTRALPAR